MAKDAHHVGVFAISVAADMVAMQIQNLRVYERHGLVDPDRTAGGSRLYSPADIAVLHRIRELLADGLNLAGIAKVLTLERDVLRLRRDNARLRESERKGEAAQEDGLDVDPGRVFSEHPIGLAPFQDAPAEAAKP